MELRHIQPTAEVCRCRSNVNRARAGGAWVKMDMHQFERRFQVSCS